MGNGIAQVFAAAGYPVTMRDLGAEFLNRGMATVSKSLDRTISRGKLTDQDRDAVLARVHPTTELEDLAQCDIVVEAILENYELKAGLIRELDAICGANTIFATNTSSISVTQIAAASNNPSRMVGMHFFLCRRAQILVVPGLEAGNMLAKNSPTALTSTFGEPIVRKR
jgi:3-hydroxybutyryl-CoA dehydrogenase